MVHENIHWTSVYIYKDILWIFTGYPIATKLNVHLVQGMDIFWIKPEIQGM